MRKISAFILILLISACATTPKPRMVAFNEADFVPYSEAGDNKIIGQAFLKTRGGDVKFGAGNEVVLVAVTPYTTETYERGILRGERLEPFDSRYSKYRRTTIADGQGNFEFNNIPSGEYYLSCVITWEVAAGNITGGVAHDKITLRRGETVKVILTRR